MIDSNYPCQNLFNYVSQSSSIRVKGTEAKKGQTEIFLKSQNLFCT